MTTAAATAKLAGEIAQGFLEFDIRAPYRALLTPQEAAAALTLAACFLAGGNAENILSIIRLVFATADVMRET